MTTLKDCEILFQELEGAAMLTLDTGHGNLCGSLFDIVERFGMTHVHDNESSQANRSSR